LAACAPPPNVVVVERDVIDSRLATEKIGGAHVRIAQPGDSLYGIAFENGLSPNKLAAWNGLSDTAHLSIGQRIRLTQPIGFVAKKKTFAPKRPSTKVATKSTPVVKPTSGATSTKTAATKTSSSNRNRSRVSTVVQGKPVSRAMAGIDWHWPTKGKVINKFALASGQQGIDIGGKRGQAVLASSSGEVVYVGNGLKGYGNLVIIKHSEQYLSAYAHNLETFVQEGQAVNARHRIASLGRNKQKRDALHFQIRRDGEPVDPLRFLKTY